MFQHLLRISLSRGQHASVEEFRERVAKHMNGVSGASHLFHYSDEGAPLQGVPLCRFVGGQGWIGFLSERGEGDVSQITTPAIKAISDMNLDLSGLKIETHKKSGNTSIDGSPFFYVLSRAVDRKNSQIKKTLSDEVLAQRMIERMLEEGAKAGSIIDLPPSSELDIKIHDIRCRGLQLTFASGSTARYAHMLNATFTMNMNLSGLWQAGQLQSRGHGMIYKRNHGGFYL